MVAWLKAKHAAEKTKGKYKSNHNDGTRRKRRNKVSDKMRVAIKASQPHVVLRVRANGKRVFVRE